MGEFARMPYIYTALRDYLDADIPILQDSSSVDSYVLFLSVNKAWMLIRCKFAVRLVY